MEKNLRGFTLVEMIVVLAIITIVTSTTLLSHGTFDRSMLLTDAAYTMALSVREMQTYGLSSRINSSYTNVGYGMYLNQQTPNVFVTYADLQRFTGASQTHCPSGTNPASPEWKRGNCMYEVGGSPTDAIVETFSFSRGFTISHFCGRTTAGSTFVCSNDQTNPLTAMDVVFMRPNTDSVVTGRRGNTAVELTSAQIYIRTADSSATRGICVSQIGQISVATGNCP